MEKVAVTVKGSNCYTVGTVYSQQRNPPTFLYEMFRDILRVWLGRAWLKSAAHNFLVSHTSVSTSQHTANRCQINRTDQVSEFYEVFFSLKFQVSLNVSLWVVLFIYFYLFVLFFLTITMTKNTFHILVLLTLALVLAPICFNTLKMQ